MKLNKEQLLGLVRHALTFLGGLLIMNGVIDESSYGEISGSLLALVGAVWSVVDKNKKVSTSVE